MIRSYWSYCVIPLIAWCKWRASLKWLKLHTDFGKFRVLVHFTAASSVCVHFLLIQYSVPLLSRLQFPANKMVWNMHNNNNSTDMAISNLWNAKLRKGNLRNWHAKLGKLQNAKCETTVYVNEQQAEDVKDWTAVLVANFFVFFSLSIVALQFVKSLIYLGLYQCSWCEIMKLLWIFCYPVMRQWRLSVG